MKKFKTRIELVVDAETPEEAANKAVANVLNETVIEVDVFGYLASFIRGFVKRVTVVNEKPTLPPLKAKRR